MLEVFQFLTSRHVIVGLAVVGALLSVSGSYALSGSFGLSRRQARFVVNGGYAITSLSVLGFIVAGFLRGE
jgi:hypothetical protein